MTENFEKPAIITKRLKKTTSEKLKCEICFQQFTSKDKLKSHNNDIHMLGKLKRCSHCDFKTEQTGWACLKDHIDAKHPDSSERRHICKQCNSSFIYEHTLTRHKLTHNEKIKHVCDICGAEYLSIQNFREHMLFKHNSKDATSLVCEICGFSTISRLKLSVHIHAKHAVGKHKQCTFCDFKTPWSQKLQIHIDVKHPEQATLNQLLKNHHFGEKVQEYHSSVVGRKPLRNVFWRMSNVVSVFRAV